MKRVDSILSIIGALAGFLLLLGPPAWQEVNRAITYAILITLLIALIAAGIISIRIYLDQRRPPYA